MEKLEIEISLETEAEEELEISLISEGAVISPERLEEAITKAVGIALGGEY